MNVRLGWTIVGVLVCAPAVALAQEEEPPAAVDAKPREEQVPKEEPAKQQREAAASRNKAVKEAPEATATADPVPPTIERHRLTLGMSMPVGIGGTSGGAGVGALATMPYATAGYETRMAGPAWFLVALRGGIDGSGTEDEGYGSWVAGGTVGLRVETPVHEYVEVGGYGRFGGSLGETTYDSSWQLAAEAGAGLHFRPTRLFGVRLCVEVLEWGYAESHFDGIAYGSVYAHLKASPSLDLTFSL